ncbi:uncharacterized protein LOC131301588 [Rhododendron vialii]|uniref:uncharacterized protein LOC131301588 n=1 Tax=Rhododendron vialii TaxID=182163 RepID=UPI0026602772|nr:uncharacterized protein LOC131301588 [Rhododendron vialii]
MNGLSVNVLTEKQQGLLEVIDQIDDPQLKMKVIETCISSMKEEEEEKPQLPNENYSLKIILDRLEQVDNLKPVTIPDLKNEINTLKAEIRSLKTFQSKAAQEFYDIKTRLVVLENKGESSKVDDLAYLNSINKVVYQKWHIKVNLVIHKEYTINNIIALVDSGADMNCYWQIQIQESDRYKTAFAVPFGHFEWNVMPFENIDQHVKHLRIFKDVIKRNGLVVSAPKMKLFQTKVRFLGHNIHQGKIIPIDRSIEFASKFPDEIRDKNQLQRFLGSLNYIGDYYKELAQDSAPLYDRLKKNPPPWSEQHTRAVRKIKLKAKQLPCLAIANPDWKKIVETDASNLGYGGMNHNNFVLQRTILLQYLKLQRAVFNSHVEMTILKWPHTRSNVLRWVHTREALLRHYQKYGTDDDEDWDMEFLQLTIDRLQSELILLSTA